MTKHAIEHPRRLVNAEAMDELVLLEVELMHQEAKLRNFGRLRDSLTASGGDATEMYRRIELRRGEVVKELRRRTPAPVSPDASKMPSHASPHGSLLNSSVTPPTLGPDISGLHFGYSGIVQMGRASEGATIVPDTITGSIRTYNLYDDGRIAFDGDIHADLATTAKEHFTTHSWTNLIPFPAPVVASTFTYRLKVNVSANVKVELPVLQIPLSWLPTTFWTWVAVGHTENFVGQEVAVNSFAGWPLVADLEQTSYFVNFIGTDLILQRSFVVKAGQTPAVALARGVAVALQSAARVWIDPASEIAAGINVPPNGYIEYGAVTFRYDPIPPLIMG